MPPPNPDRVVAWLQIFEKLTDKLGIPAAFLLLVYMFVTLFASTEQKHALIDMYLLGRGINSMYPFALEGVAFLLLFYSQNYWFRKKIKVLENELKRMGDQKSSLQENQIGEQLPHS